MAEVKGGYQRPTFSSNISDSWQGHRNRKPPSTEPGTDYGVAYGSSLFAAEDGTVVDVKHTVSGAMGRRLTIDLNDGRRVSYLHLKSIHVALGARVKRGQLLGYTGASAWGKEWGLGAHVHTTLWDRHAYSFGVNATIDFEKHVGPDNDVAYNQDVANRQGFLNDFRGERLVIDGLNGPNTHAAIKRYQTFLRDNGYGYTGPIDGDWGNGTQAAHQKYWDKVHAKPTNPAYHTATVADLADLQWVNGLQKIAHLYGYGKGQSQSVWMDNKWGPGSRSGLQRFLDQNYGGSLARWLRAKWGYKDADDLWGPNMKAAAQRAEAANYKAL